MIKETIIQYRNENPKYSTLLGTVLGELDRITKNPTDEQVIQVIKKMMESNTLIGKTQQTIEENFILSRFLPSQMSVYEIMEIIETEEFASLKECMAYFKGNYAGLYDGKIVNSEFQNYQNYLKINKI